MSYPVISIFVALGTLIFPALSAAAEINITYSIQSGLICINLDDPAKQIYRVDGIVREPTILSCVKDAGMPPPKPGDRVRIAVGGRLQPETNAIPSVDAYLTGFEFVEEVRCVNRSSNDELILRGGAREAFNCNKLDFSDGDKFSVIAIGVIADPAIITCPCLTDRLEHLETTFASFLTGPLQLEECSIPGAGGLQYIAQGQGFVPELRINVAESKQECSVNLNDSPTSPIVMDERMNLTPAQVAECVRLLSGLCPSLP